MRGNFVSFNEKEIKELYKLIGKMPISENKTISRLSFKWYEKLRKILYS